VVVETAGAARDGQLENSLCEIDPNQSIVHLDSSFCCDRQRLWHIDAAQVAGGVHFINDAGEAGASDGASPLNSVLGGANGARQGSW
jgi:hypothetical protein